MLRTTYENIVKSFPKLESSLHSNGLHIGKINPKTPHGVVTFQKNDILPENSLIELYSTEQTAKQSFKVLPHTLLGKNTPQLACFHHELPLNTNNSNF
jgi:hypothetical protein